MGYKGGTDYNIDIERGSAPETGWSADRGSCEARRRTKAQRTENERAERKKSSGRQIRGL